MINRNNHAIRIVGRPSHILFTTTSQNNATNQLDKLIQPTNDMHNLIALITQDDGKIISTDIENLPTMDCERPFPSHIQTQNSDRLWSTQEVKNIIKNVFEEPNQTTPHNRASLIAILISLATGKTIANILKTAPEQEITSTTFVNTEILTHGSMYINKIAHQIATYAPEENFLKTDRTNHPENIAKLANNMTIYIPSRTNMPDAICIPTKTETIIVENNKIHTISHNQKEITWNIMHTLQKNTEEGYTLCGIN